MVDYNCRCHFPTPSTENAQVTQLLRLLQPSASQTISHDYFLFPRYIRRRAMRKLTKNLEKYSGIDRFKAMLQLDHEFVTSGGLDSMLKNTLLSAKRRDQYLAADLIYLGASGSVIKTLKQGSCDESIRSLVNRGVDLFEVDHETGLNFLSLAIKMRRTYLARWFLFAQPAVCKQLAQMPSGTSALSLAISNLDFELTMKLLSHPSSQFLASFHQVARTAHNPLDLAVRRMPWLDPDQPYRIHTMFVVASALVLAGCLTSRYRYRLMATAMHLAKQGDLKSNWVEVLLAAGFETSFKRSEFENVFYGLTDAGRCLADMATSFFPLRLQFLARLAVLRQLPIGLLSRKSAIDDGLKDYLPKLLVDYLTYSNIYTAFI